MAIAYVRAALHLAMGIAAGNASAGGLKRC
jgi:hypothetical protein